MAKKTLKDIVTKESYQKHDGHKKSENREIYIPKWAQTLIDLYTSPLKYEILYGT